MTSIGSSFWRAGHLPDQKWGLVIGDQDLLVLKKFRGNRILSLRGFLELLDRR
jgi:hypothetical protein